MNTVDQKYVKIRQFQRDLYPTSSSLVIEEVANH